MTNIETLRRAIHWGLGAIVFVFAFLRLGIAYAQAPDPKSAEVPAVSSSPAIDQIIDAKIADIRKEAQDQRYPALRQVRIDIIRALEEIKLKKSNIAQELAAMDRDGNRYGGPILSELPDINFHNADIENLERLLASTNEELAQSPGNGDLKTRKTALENDLTNTKAKRESLKKEIERRAALTKSVEAVRDTQNKKQEQLKRTDLDLSRVLLNLTASQSVVEDEVSALLRIDGQRNAFKTQIAFAFTALVGLVIVGFFVVAGFDVAVRRSIFSSQSGIQFITLFSVVIAIILFGITGILESKELSALLGGLSGYILGRSTVGATPAPDPMPVSAPTPAPGAAPAAAPAPGAAAAPAPAV